MGLQNQLTDVSSESIPILIVAIIADCVCYLRSLLSTILYRTGVLSPRSNPDEIDDTVGSGLAGVVLLAEQLNLNRMFSYRLAGEGGDCGCGGGEFDSTGSVCVFCLNRLGDGDHVRKLECGHVFHKDCLDGWLDQLNFNCPLCRSPLISAEHVKSTRCRVGKDVLNWFSFR